MSRTDSLGLTGWYSYIYARQIGFSEGSPCQVPENNRPESCFESRCVLLSGGGKSLSSQYSPLLTLEYRIFRSLPVLSCSTVTRHLLRAFSMTSWRFRLISLTSRRGHSSTCSKASVK